MTIKIIFNKFLKKLWHESAYLNNQIFMSLVEPGKNLRVLDLGCDNGNICYQRFHDRLKKSNIYGVDIDLQKLKAAQKLGLKTYKANIEKRLPFSDNYFDIVTANQIIEHLVNTDNFIKEIYRVLKPNGYMIISTENLSSWHNIGALIIGWHPFSLHVSTKYNIGNPLRIGNVHFTDPTSFHVKNFTIRSLSELCRLYDLTVEKFYGAGYYPFPGLLSKILSKLDYNHAVFIGLKARKKI